MKEAIITANTSYKPEGAEKSVDLQVSSKFNMPETVKEAVNFFGEDVCLSIINSKVVIMVQAKQRGEMKKQYDATGSVDSDVVQEAVSAYKPGIVTPKEVNIEKFQKQLDSLTDEQRAALLAKYAG